MHASAEVLKTIAESEIGRRILSEAASERLEARRALVAERDRIKGDGERRSAAAARTHAEAKAARDQAEAVLKVAQIREMEAVHAWSNISSSMERGIFRCNRELEATADPRIDEMVTWLQNAHNLACSAPDPAPPLKLSLAMRMFSQAAESPPPSKGPFAPEIIRAAIVRARELKHEALDVEELGRRLDAIVASVPSEYAAGGRP